MSFRRTPMFISFTLMLLLTVLLPVLLAVTARATLAAPFDVPLSIRSPALSGTLPTQFSAHYLGLTTTERDGIIRLTLTYDPQFDLRVTGFVNFLVLTDDGLRRYLAGGDARVQTLPAVARYSLTAQATSCTRPFAILGAAITQ